MDAIELLTGRRSHPRLVDPPPPPEAVEIMIRAALQAPDHGLLRPWRFLTIQGRGRDRLGEVCAAGLKARAPDTPAVALANLSKKPLRAPLIIVAIARCDPAHPKIPETEQIASAAAAAHGIGLCAWAMGYGCMWRTGEAAYDPVVASALGLAPGERIVGFLYLGTPAMAPPPKPDCPVPADFVSVWPAA